MLRALADGPLRLSALGKRLGRRSAGPRRPPPPGGPRGGRAGPRRPGLPRGARGRAGRRRAPSRAGRAQAAVLERLRAAGGRARVADLVRDRPSLRGAVGRLAETGALRLVDGARRRDAARACRRATRRPSLPTPGPGGGARARSSTAVERGGVPAVPAPRRDRQRQDRGVLPCASRRRSPRGRGAIILVPEIALTPMLVRAARSRFGATVSVLHSELSAGERHDQWWRIREGEARVVVGARSAVFAPIPDLGLVVVDEEHDGAYKQEESPRYHARDVAVMRARLEGCPVVLGSATPSLESHANALRGQVRAARPARGASGRRACRAVEIVDRREVLRGGRRPDPEPGAARGARRAPRARASRASLLLNRRGYATSLLCRECGQEAMCPNCSVVADAAPGRALGALPLLRPRGAGARPPARRAAAPTCGSPASAPRRWRRPCQAALPAARVDRLDRDRARRRGVLAQTLAAFESGRDRRPRRHADDRQGARLPASDPGRRRRRRRGPRHPRLPLGGADLPAPHPGGGPRRPRRERRARSSSRATCPTTTPSASPARRTTTRSSSARWSSGGRWATRRWPRSST